MSFLINIFNTILYRPLFNFLVLLYKHIPGHDFGLAIIILTVSIKLLLYPLGTRAIKSQKDLSEIQPQVKEIQEKYKDNKEEQMREIMGLYKKAKVSPFSGFLLLLIQLPILIALYRVFWRGLQSEQMVFLYSFISIPESVNSSFLGVINLAQPHLVLALLAGILQFFLTKMTIPKAKLKNKPNKKSDFSNIMQKQMQYFFPIFTVLILFRLPSAIGLYWITTTLFSIIQQYFVFKKRLKQA